MTLEEACRFIDPATDLDEIDKIIYYHGFNGKKVAGAVLREASQMVVDFVRWMSWHDAKNPPPVHDERWKCDYEEHSTVASDIVWVCCQNGCTAQGYFENGKWYLDSTGGLAEDEPCGQVKLWAPLLEAPKEMLAGGSNE